jgi:plasmid stability protein
MGQILIRNLDDAVLDALRGRARERGSSLEEEARQALAAAVGLSRAEALRRVQALQAKIGRLPGETSLEILRRDRARDDPDHVE